MNEMPPTRRESPYRRILADIEAQITNEGLHPGDVLPTRVELAKRYSTARATVDKALAELARKGLIESGSGRRTVVVGAKPNDDLATTIGVLWHWTEDQEKRGGDYLDVLVRGIREACAEYMLQVRFRGAPLYTWPELVNDRSTHGLLIVRPDYADASILDAIQAAGVPVVLVPGVWDGSGIPSVSADNAGGTAAAVEHLYQLGHREIGFVGLTATVPDHFERLMAFLHETGMRDISVRPEWIRLGHESQPSNFRNHLFDWLENDRYPSAVISSDFMMTLSVLGRLSELGLSVPGDVSVVTFDDPAAAGQMHPSLTAIAQPISRLGYQAVQRLRECIAGIEVPAIDRLSTELIPRGSTGPPNPNRSTQAQRPT